MKGKDKCTLGSNALQIHTASESDNLILSF